MSSGTRRVAVVVGIRPHFVKLAAFAAPLRRDHDLVVIHTGQHYDPAMTTDHLGEVGLPGPDIVCTVGSGSHAEQTARGILALEEAFAKTEPELVLAIGDGNSSLAAALTAAKLGIRVAHLEAGGRSFDRTLPEEINRLAIDAVSDLHLTTGPIAHARLAASPLERPPVFVGDTLLDVILSWLPQITERAASWSTEPTRPVLVTFHRARTLRDRTVLADVVRGVAAIPAPVVCVLHPGTERALREAGLLATLAAHPSVRLVPALSHLDLLGLIMACSWVLTDSNGVQREALHLGRPCYIMRESTEFQETLELAAGALVGTNPEAIANPPAIADIDVAAVHAAFGDGRAGARIAAAVREVLA